jgi:hypothetical protein
MALVLAALASEAGVELPAGERDALGREWDAAAYAAAVWDAASWSASPWAPLTTEIVGSSAAPAPAGAPAAPLLAWAPSYWGAASPLAAGWDAKFWGAKFWGAKFWGTGLWQ